MIDGKLNADEVYYLHEVRPPYGYEAAKDIEFKVPHGQETWTINLVNQAVNGKKEEDVTTKPDVSVYKYDGNSMLPIAGVEFTVYRDGSEWTKVKTDDTGYARISALSDGDYRIIETGAAAGYFATPQELTFTVKDKIVTSGITAFKIPNYKGTMVTVTKRNGENDRPLRGARLCVVDEDGKVVYEGTTDSNGEISFPVYKAGHYAVTEKSAPWGYELFDGYITFHVTETGMVTGTTTMYNYKIWYEGKITARYENGFERGGWYDSGGR